MRTKIKEKLIEVLENLIGDSTTHGLPRIVKSRSYFIKTIWAICTIISTSVCIYQIHKSIVSYLDYDTTISVENIVEIPSPFPEVMICNLNPFQTDLALSFLRNNPISNSKFENIQIKIGLMNQISSFNDTFKKQFGFKINEILIDCTFNTRKCDSGDFEWYFHSFYGNCFRFKPLNFSNKSISQTGVLFGLGLKLFSGNLESIPALNEKSGYQIIISNQSNQPLFNEGITISPGMESNLKVERLFRQQVGQPYNDCLENLTSADAFDSELYRTIIKSNITYTQLHCFFYCAQKNINENCKCDSNFFPKLNLEGNLCLDNEKLECALDAVANFYNGDSVKSCSQYCPLECKSQKFQISTSFAQFPIDQYARELMNNSFIKSRYLNKSLTVENIKNSVLALNIYYDDLSYVIISEKPALIFVDLLSTIGGIGGLFIGISFLSFVEIIEISLEIFNVLFSTRNDVNIT